MLTKRQHEVLHFISTFQEEHGIAPTVREVARASNLASCSTAFKHMNTLKAKGYLEKNRAGWRSYIKTSKSDHTSIKGSANAGFREVTIIGKLCQHERIELFETIASYLLPQALLPAPATYYGFIIKDNSFAEQLLLAGDLIIIDTQTQPAIGDLILVDTKNGGAELHEFGKSKFGKSKNKNLKKDLAIHGKVALSIRSYTSSSDSGSKSSKL